ncbi:MAG: hypothetical protein QOE76_1954 [Frankiales bacterium]|jgi:glycosyltransferase involved in cell wall biosynthesis|nr:hypothetical protein [Pseudonocardiales bacterium]MDX6244231.1 hypothetical protein [Frankiales bacterium]
MARVLLFCHDVLGQQMAGPAIRYWELAHQLARRHSVTLAVPTSTDLQSDTVRIVSYAGRSYAELLRAQDVVVTQLVWPRMLAAARRLGVRIVADFYDPIVLEDLENHRGSSPAGRRARNQRSLAKTRLSLLAADAVICASERQRDLWLGALMELDRIRPDAYDSDPSMHSLVEVVPFGMPDGPPLRTGPGFRDALGIGAADKVLLWGGGVWNWFDPLTLIEAMKLVVSADPSVHLVFMGLRHPNALVPASAMAARALELAERTGLLGRNVHANTGWVPYAERQNHLLDADIGVSTHFDHLETRFAFRTRILDYLWAGLPLLLTQGDSFGDLVASRGLGIAVPPEDPMALRDAILRLTGDADLRARAQAAVIAGRGEFTWERSAAGLDRVVESVLASSPPTLPWRAVAHLYATSVREVVVERRAGELVRRVVERRK